MNQPRRRETRRRRPAARRLARWLRQRAVPPARLLAMTGSGAAGRRAWPRRAVLAAVLLAVALVPYPSQGDPAFGVVPGCRAACHAAEQNMVRWTQPLPGSWVLLPGVAGTAPASGQVFVAAGYGTVAVGENMTVYGYAEKTGAPRWQRPLTGFPAGAAIVSVRTWPGEVTAGVMAPGKDQRTEVVLDSDTGVVTGQYPAAPLGGAVGVTAAGQGSRMTVIVGPTAVTSYAAATGRMRWRRATGSVPQVWRTDGTYLYLAESATGYLGAAPVTALRRIDMATGAERQVIPLTGTAFAGILTAAFDGVVLFSSAAGVTAYDGGTGLWLWSIPGAVAEGADPGQHRLYLSRGGTLLSVNPLTGRFVVAAGLGGGMYVIRDGVALGFDAGSDGAAWGYDIPAQRVTMAAQGLNWPHFFTDLSGLGGSADPGGDLVVIAACQQAAVSPSPGPTGSGGPAWSSSPAGPGPASPGAGVSSRSASPGASSGPASPGLGSPPPGASSCARPELVALAL